MYILGIDGGGTKTKANLFHKEKGFIWEEEEKAANPHSTSYAQSVEVVNRIINKAYESHFLSENTELSIGLGIAGLGRKADQIKWLKYFQNSSRHLHKIKETVVENDGKIALYSETLGRDGIVSICGTGAITIGVHEAKTIRIGGWGHLVGGDPGSGYHIGSQALIAVFNELDGLGPETMLTNLILDGEAINKMEELIPILYQNVEKQRIAAFAGYVFQAADQKDEVAINIIRETAKEIARRGGTLFQKLFQTDVKDIPFVLTGGIFQNEFIVKEVTAELAATAPVKVIKAKRHPVAGSIVLVLKQQGYSAEQIGKMLTNTSDRQKRG
ncbi:N-acetylglucosamine kinase [Oceanobacillus neutriphilus]|uniref:ATPase n=1 Tax=Oceanobacillus neutriphilus TaxID=531815 RepID=A0ABQ2NW55_9BACI|nr:BadF/BadG/BcrA/BcrD ATPase family protein [Oceanobacillus neutriphilus]GGP12038.1 ATPase [Oceanobacillus neutriphilus]